MGKGIEKVLTTHESLLDAEKFDIAVLNSLSGEKKIKNALELMAPIFETTQRLERVYRVVKQEELPISDNWRGNLK